MGRSSRMQSCRRRRPPSVSLPTHPRTDTLVLDGRLSKDHQLRRHTHKMPPSQRPSASSEGESDCFGPIRNASSSDDRVKGHALTNGRSSSSPSERPVLQSDIQFRGEHGRLSSAPSATAARCIHPDGWNRDRELLLPRPHSIGSPFGSSPSNHLSRV